jgi:hypothetical protein
MKVAKVVIIFISDDWTRPVWQFPQQTLECLRTASTCQGSEAFYGWPAEPSEALAQLNRIAKYRIEALAKGQSGANILLGSSVYQHLVVPGFRRLNRFVQTGSPSSDAAKQFSISKGVATEIANGVGWDNVLFIYLPQKTELDTGPQSYGRKANAFIRRSGFAFVDGRAACGLSIGDYYIRDGHPNATGYAKIARCVQRAIEGAFRPLHYASP